MVQGKSLFNAVDAFLSAKTQSSGVINQNIQSVMSLLKKLGQSPNLILRREVSHHELHGWVAGLFPDVYGSDSALGWVPTDNHHIRAHMSQF
jgi:hypothetical protein